jgi:hypothetical protein
MLQRALATRFLRPNYIHELENLAGLAEGFDGGRVDVVDGGGLDGIPAPRR